MFRSTSFCLTRTSLSLLRLGQQRSPLSTCSNKIRHTLCQCGGGSYSKTTQFLARWYVEAASTRLTIFQRVQKYIRDNPYTKFSLTLCAIVLALSIAVELSKKFKRKKPLNIVGSLPAVGHYTVQRSSEVADITNKLKSLQNKGGFPLVYITGPRGIGKSEVVRQYVKVFTQSCYKWLGLKSIQPVVLFISGKDKIMFDLSLGEAAASLGLKERDNESDKSVLSQVHSKLVESKLPWLIVVDGLDDSLLSEFSSLVSSLPHHDAGAIIVTTTSLQAPQENQLPLLERLSSDSGLELLTKLSKTKVDGVGGAELVEKLQGHPLSIALAASTIAIYKTFMQDEDTSSSPVSQYVNVLEQSIADGMGVADSVMNLYIEAAISDQKFRHTFDLLGSCDLRYPIPSSVIGRHLTSSFYTVTKEDLAPPATDQVTKFQELTGINQDEDMSYIDLVKAFIPFLGKKPPTQEQIAEVLEEADDTVFFIRGCPLLSFKKFNSGFEYIEVQNLSQKWLPLLFLQHTAPAMDKAHLAEDELNFERSAWFRYLRKFDPVKSLERYHHTLPGISAPGVLTREQYKKHSYSLPSSCAHKLSYSEYGHIISHTHRVVSTLHHDLKASAGDYRDIQLKKYLQPHFMALKSGPVISSSDCLLCEQALVSAEATTLAVNSENYQELVSRYEDVIARQRKVFGGGSQVVARTMTDLADFKYSHHDITGAQHLLLASLAILEKVPSRLADEEYKFDVGLIYSSLAYIYDDLGDKMKCKDLLERALAAYQTMPKDGQVSKRQRKLVASSLTNVAHAYLSLGDVMMAKKYVDLASVAHQNIYVEAHAESLRTMNVSSNIYAMMGDKMESIRLRTEAGKVKAKLESKPLLV